MKYLITKVLSVVTFIITLIIAIMFLCVMCFALVGNDFVLFAESSCLAVFFIYFSWVDFKYFFINENIDE